jgi:hypothetical protein
MMLKMQARLQLNDAKDASTATAEDTSTTAAE